MVMVTARNEAMGTAPPPGGKTGEIRIERVKLVIGVHTSGGQVPAYTPVGPGCSMI